MREAIDAQRLMRDQRLAAVVLLSLFLVALALNVRNERALFRFASGTTPSAFVAAPIVTDASVPGFAGPPAPRPGAFVGGSGVGENGVDPGVFQPGTEAAVFASVLPQAGFAPASDSTALSTAATGGADPLTPTGFGGGTGSGASDGAGGGPGTGGGGTGGGTSPGAVTGNDGGTGSGPGTGGGNGGGDTDGGPGTGGGGGTPTVIVPVVPEPRIWIMMIAGFAMIGSALRRRRRTRPIGLSDRV